MIWKGFGTMEMKKFIWIYKNDYGKYFDSLKKIILVQNIIMS